MMRSPGVRPTLPVKPARVIAFRCAGFMTAAALLLSAACGSEQQPTPTPTPMPSSPSRVAADFFPVTVVVETDKGWLTVSSVTRLEAPESQDEVTLVFEGNVKVISAGRFDYGLSLTDSEGATYKDTGGILLGEREQGEEPSYETSITVPADATFTRLGFWLAGKDKSKLSYVIDLPVAGIPVAGP